MAKRRIKAALGRERIVTENSDAARELYNQSRFGSMLENGRVQLSLLEGLYLLEAGKLSVKDASGKKMDFNAFLKKAQKVEPKFHIRYLVFKDMRSRGYIVKTALKFGADFRVYDRDGVADGLITYLNALDADHAAAESLRAKAALADEIAPWLRSQNSYPKTTVVHMEAGPLAFKDWLARYNALTQSPDTAT